MLKNEFFLRGSDGGVGARVGGDLDGGKEKGVLVLGDVEMDIDAEDEVERKEREVKDKERWARLRRVKSLFDTKPSKKLQRPSTAKGKGS